MRVRVFSRGAGKWEESGGETSKFGINTIQLLDCLKLRPLTRIWRAISKCCISTSGLRLPISAGSRTPSRKRRASMPRSTKWAIPIEYLNVGGGLGVDYDGSRTASDCSVNYSMQEFANDIVYTINEICQSENVPPPTIVTESGRAVAAHHAVFVTNVIRTLNPGLGGTEISPSKVDSEVVREMMDLYKDDQSEKLSRVLPRCAAAPGGTPVALQSGLSESAEPGPGRMAFLGNLPQIHQILAGR